jgi:hypothetical protein
MKLRLLVFIFSLGLLLSAPCSAFTLIFFGKEEQKSNAVQPTLNPAVSLSQGVSQSICNLQNRSSSRGLQFKDPVFAPAVFLRLINDESPGGFYGDEFGQEFSFDADIYNGLIAGLFYQHTYRDARNDAGTDEALDSHGTSFYLAKRLANLFNVGASFNYVSTDHGLSPNDNNNFLPGITANLDRETQGFTLFGGLSDRKDKWSWSTMATAAFSADDYAVQEDLNTGLFGISGNLAYDFHKYLTIGAAINYTNLIFQDTFPDTGIRDDDYYTIGPRVRIYPTDHLTVRLEFDSQFGYRDLSAHTLRAAIEYAF